VEQPDLDRVAVSPGRARTRRLLHFLVLGVLLFAGKRVVGGAAARPASPPLVVEVPAGADETTRRRAVVDAVLVEEAVRAGWPLADPVVRHRLLETLGAGGATPAALAHTLAPGLRSIDPATRARLAWIGRELVRAQVAPRAPTVEELAAYVADHPGRYRPVSVAFRQRLIGRARHGEHADADARALLARLDGPDAAGGDPTLLPARIAGALPAIDARFGAGFAAQLVDAPFERWAGPYPGTFGLHLVWRERVAPPPAGPDPRVALDWAHDQHEVDSTRAIDALVAARRVVLREVAP
jgi:hypothetical protein